MTQEVSQITDSNPVEMLSDRELAEETLRVLRSLDITLTRMMTAWSAGGVKGLRSAARGFAARPMDPDRQAFLERGLAELDRHAQATRERPVAGCPHEPACLNAALCLSAR